MTAKRTRQGGEGPFRLQSIRSRLLVAFILLVLLPTVAVSLSSALMGYQNGKRQAFEQLESIVALKEAEIRTWAQGLTTELSFAVSGAQSYRWVESLINNHIERASQRSDSPSGAQYAYLMLRDSFLRITESKRETHFKEIFLVALDGTILLSTDVWNEGLEVSDNHFFQMGLKVAGMHVERAPLGGEGKGRWSIMTVEPVFGSKGRILGVLAGRANTDRLNQSMMQRSGLGRTGETYLLGEGGVLLSNSRFDGYVRGESVLSDYSRLFAGENTSGEGLYDDYRGIPVIGVHHRLPNLELVLVAEMDQAEAFEPIYETLQINLMVGLMAVLAAVLASAIYTRGLAGRLSRLSTTAHSISRGNLETSAPVTGEQEIRTLAASFNAMTARLSRRIEMENLVAVISRELIGIFPENANKVIQDSLALVGRYLDVERLDVFLLREGGVVDSLVGWSAEGVSPRERRVKGLALDTLSWFHRVMEEEGLVHVPRLDDLPPEAGRERDLWLSLGVKSLAVTPMKPGGELRGFLSCETCWGERSFGEDELGLLEIVADSVGSAADRVAVLRALRRSEERYSLAQKAANIASWEWDIRHSRVFCSDAFETIMGLAPGSFDNTFRAFLRLAHPEDRHLLLASVRDTFRKGAVFSAEHRVQGREDEDALWINSAGALYCDDEGKPLRMLGIVRDITDRKRAEDELAAINRDLEQLVEARTRDFELKADELSRANARLRELDQLKSSFLASVSHELRTPLTSILGFTKLIQKDYLRHVKGAAGLDGPKGRRIESNLGIILKEGERLTRLINDVLDLTKIEAGRVEWRDREVSLQRCIENAIEATSIAFSEKPEVKLYVHIEQGLPTIFVDEDRIAQVLINLLGNALKFTSKGFIRLQAQRNGQFVRIGVQDTGYGIEEGELEKVFETFHQANTFQTLEDKPEGTGLGLTISRQIIEHYGGNLWAESESGKGSTFFIELPLERPPEDDMEQSWFAD